MDISSILIFDCIRELKIEIWKVHIFEYIGFERVCRIIKKKIYL